MGLWKSIPVRCNEADAIIIPADWPTGRTCSLVGGVVTSSLRLERIRDNMATSSAFAGVGNLLRDFGGGLPAFVCRPVSLGLIGLWGLLRLDGLTSWVLLSEGGSLLAAPRLAAGVRGIVW